jgi:peptidoglycan/xylan/chitin deacetylase (PgdA/CDA1 family)
MSSPDHRIPAGALIGAAGCAALAVHALPALAAPLSALRGPLGIEERTAGGEGYALTFDDGPHPQGTPAVLEALAAARVTATFFLVGEQVQRAPSLAREIVAAGHAIGLHCHRHRNLLRLTPAQTRSDIACAEAVIAEATGRRPSLYRPPYGVLNAWALSHARARRWRTLLWTHWGRDWEARASAAGVAALATRGAGAGSVILLHDADHYSAAGSWRRTAAALPRIIAVLAGRGLQPAAL